MAIRVAISEYCGFRLSDEAILLCVARGMTMGPDPSENDNWFIPGFNFYPWGESHAADMGQKYHVRGESDNTFRTNPVVLGVLEELGDQAMACLWPDQQRRFKIIEIPFDSIDGWHIRDQECGTGEYICENHRKWS